MTAAPLRVTNPRWRCWSLLEIARFLLDSISLLSSWIMSCIFLGSTLVISNQTNENLGVIMYTTAIGPRGYGDFTWRVKGQRDIIERKAAIWTVRPGRMNPFMLPFMTTLVVIGTENNFKYWILNEFEVLPHGPTNDCLKFRFASIWSTYNFLVPRFVSVIPDRSLSTSCKTGQCLPGHELLNRLATEFTYFKPNLEIALAKMPQPLRDLTSKVMLPAGERVTVGETLWSPEDNIGRSLTISSLVGHSGHTMEIFNLLQGLINEVSALIEVIAAEHLYEKLMAGYIFLQIMIWNSLKEMISPAGQYRAYGKDGYVLSKSFDCVLVALCQSIPGGLQAILVLLIGRPREGIQLLSVLLGFANAAFFFSALSLRIMHFTETSWFSCCGSENRILVFRILLGLLLVGFPAFAVVSVGYYAQSDWISDVIKYAVGSILVVGFHIFYVLCLPDLDAAIKRITPIAAFALLSKQCSLLSKLISLQSVKWLIHQLEKYFTEFLVFLLVFASVIINAFILFDIKGRSLD